jgi:hypothetical protein
LYQRLTSVSAVPGTRTIWTIGIGDLVERFC